MNITVNRILLLVMLLFLLSASTLCADNSLKLKLILIAFRFDDYSTKSQTNIEKKIIDTLSEHNISGTFGVTPFNGGPLTTKKSNTLTNAIREGILEVALHGYDHNSIRKDRKSEFYGLTVNQQRDRIARAKAFLEQMLEVEIKTFIPPYNSYDINTIKALESVNFRNLSANCLGVATRFSGLNFLPTTIHINEVKGAIDSARLMSEPQSLIIVMFHHYDFVGVDKSRGKITYKDFVKLLDWIVSQNDISVVTIDQAARILDDTGVDRYSKARNYFKWDILIPDFFKETLNIPLGVYLTRETIDQVKGRLLAGVFSFYFVLFLVCNIITFYFSNVVFLKSPTIKHVFLWGGTVFFLLASIHTLQDPVRGMITASSLIFALGLCSGSWFCYFKLRRQGRLINKKTIL